MKKGDRIEISNKARYAGQTMNWTEEKTATVTLEAGTVLYHVSSTKLTSFFPKTTCFNTDKLSEGHYYALKVINPVKADEYDNEYRIDLEKYAGAVEMYYIGTVERKQTGKMVEQKRGGFVPEYKTIDRTIEYKEEKQNESR